MVHQLCLHLTSGQDVIGHLTRQFSRDDVTVEIFDTARQLKRSYDLDDICIIFFVMAPAWMNDAEPTTDEDIQVVTGGNYPARVFTNRHYNKGFFGQLLDESFPYRMAFFTFTGIRSRAPQCYLGNLLQESGAVTEDGLNETLREQERLRTRRLGEVLADAEAIPQAEIETALQAGESRPDRPASTRVGDILVESGLVTRPQVERAFLTQQSGKKLRVGELLISQGLISEEQLLSALAKKFHLRLIDLGTTTPSPEALGRLSERLAGQLGVLPLELRDNTLVVATSEPTNPIIFDSLKFNTNCAIELVVASAQQIAAAIDKHYRQGKDSVELLLDAITLDASTVVVEEEVEEERVVEPDSAVIALINRILLHADKHRASDIHFEPGIGKTPVLVRYRIDGECIIAHRIDSSFKSAIVSRLKIISGLDITERRRPQSGKIVLRIAHRKLEYRLEVTPTVGGQEDAVLRLLTGAKPLSLAEIGLQPHIQEQFGEILAKPYGIILCVGPTGSGKTTTLHSALNHINTPLRKIWTAEDPVEITQPGLRQVQVNPKIGFTFAEALRSFLRADPDVIMVGEMRDAETAKIAIESSLTGHLVFSTLHTNSAPETVVRLVDMGMDPVNFADALLGVLSQRLTRALCPYCKKSGQPSQEEYDTIVAEFCHDAGRLPDDFPVWESATVMTKCGCERCGGTGYKGRLPLHELLRGSTTMKDAIRRGAGVAKIRDIAINEGMWTLKMDGIMKVLNGDTDMEQVRKVCI